jgi:hypothetical protein
MLSEVIGFPKGTPLPFHKAELSGVRRCLEHLQNKEDIKIILPTGIYGKEGLNRSRYRKRSIQALLIPSIIPDFYTLPTPGNRQKYASEHDALPD